MSSDPLDLLLQAPPFAAARQTPAFLPAVEACLEVLRARFPRYADFLARGARSRKDGPLAPPAPVHDLPALFLPVLKGLALPLPADLAVVIRLTSSGTTGRPSETPLDEPSWRRRVAALRASYEGLGLFTGAMQALAFLMDPSTTQVAGSVVIDAVLRQVPQVRSLTYLARRGATGPEFRPAEAAAALIEAAGRGPILLVGYPALLAASMQALQAASRDCLPLAEGSCILTGGGWKSFLPGVSLDQHEFRERATAFFRVPPAAIRDMFGLSECPAVFVQCEQGHYHAPPWAWPQAIDPETGDDVPHGQVGLLQLTVPLTTSYPLLKVLTTDKVLLQEGCACGRPSSFLVPCGRVTAARFETCAMQIGRAIGVGEVRV